MSSNSDSVIKLKLQACKVDRYVQVPDSFLSLCMKPEDCCKLSHSSTKLFALIQDDCLLAQESLIQMKTGFVVICVLGLAILRSLRN